MLGVRRAGVTQAAGDLQKQGIIEYMKHQIHVLDERRLLETACESSRSRIASAVLSARMRHARLCDVNQRTARQAGRP